MIKRIYLRRGSLVIIWTAPSEEIANAVSFLPFSRYNLRSEKIAVLSATLVYTRRSFRYLNRSKIVILIDRTRGNKFLLQNFLMEIWLSMQFCIIKDFRRQHFLKLMEFCDWNRLEQENLPAGRSVRKNITLLSLQRMVLGFFSCGDATWRSIRYPAQSQLCYIV